MLKKPSQPQANDEYIQALICSLGEGLLGIDREGCFTFVNPEAEKILGWKSEKLIGKKIHETLHCQSEDSSVLAECPILNAIKTGIRHHEKEDAFIRRDKITVPVSYIVTPITLQGNPVGCHIAFRDITQLKQIEENLKIRVRQQMTIAELSQRALAGTDLSTLMDETVARVAQILEVKYCKILELLPDGKALLLRAGVNWKEGAVGCATVGVEKSSQAGYTLRSKGPVIVKNLKTETRFSGPKLLHDHGVVSGMSVVIEGQDRPFGVLGAHAVTRRNFTQDDILFLQSVANMLAFAINRKQTTKALQEKNITLKEVLNQIELEKKTIKEGTRADIENLLLPTLRKLKKTAQPFEKKHLQILEKNLEEIAASYGHQISREMFKLSPKEIEVCNMIRSGSATKEIAEFLNVSSLTVQTHRVNIRKKLGLSNKDINLTTFLKNG